MLEISLFTIIVLVAQAEANDVFTTLPTTQYVWINQTATFTCATNVTGYSLSFSIPGELELYLDTQNPSEGGTLAAVSFTVTSDNNGTSVSCIADDGVNAPEFTALVFAYAQGPPSSVSNLTAVQQDQCSILIRWNPPYLLPGLSVSYKVYINGEMIQDDVFATNYTYYPIDLTNSTWYISMRPHNESVMGDYAFTTANFSTDYMLQISYDSDMTHKIKQGWQYYFNVNKSYSCSNQAQNIIMIACSETVHVCYNDSTVYQNITEFNKKEHTSIIAAIELPSYGVYKAGFVVEYNNGVVFTTNEVKINTYDIQGVSVINITDHGICLGLKFINYSVLALSSIYLESNGNSLVYTENDEFCNGISNVRNCYPDENMSTTYTTITATTTATVTIYTVPTTITSTCSATVLGTSVSIPSALLLISVAVNIIIFIMMGCKKYTTIKARRANVHTVSVASAHYENVTSFTSTVQLEVQDCNAYGVVSDRQLP